MARGRSYERGRDREAMQVGLRASKGECSGHGHGWIDIEMQENQRIDNLGRTLRQFLQHSRTAGISIRTMDCFHSAATNQRWTLRR